MTKETVNEKPSTHKNVYVALAAAQAQMGPLVKGSENPHFKSRYADLADLVMAVRGPLNGNGLTFFHQIIRDEIAQDMRTVIMHGESETSIHCDVPLIVDKQNMQGMKSATTYAKRIGLESVTGVAPEDDDGNAASQAQTKNPMGAAIGDAWRAGVEDSLPENATPQQKAQAYTDAICVDFKGKGEKALSNRWEKHKSLIASLEGRFPDMHARVVDEYENAMIDITAAKRHEG